MPDRKGWARPKTHLIQVDNPNKYNVGEQYLFGHYIVEIVNNDLVICDSKAPAMCKKCVKVLCPFNKVPEQTN